jgi:hypothetical protein
VIRRRLPAPRSQGPPARVEAASTGSAAPGVHRVNDENHCIGDSTRSWGDGVLGLGPRQRRVLLLLLLLFGGLTASGLHGYSISAWRHYIDGSEAKEVLLGQPRQIRSDDWNVLLPLAQRAHRPRFPVVNDDIGVGNPMLVPFAAPVAHPLTLFRPTTWGFFLGADTGVAWMWWSRGLGLLGATFVLLSVMTGGRVGLSLLGAALVVVSPFFQFWALRPAPVAMFAITSLLGALGVVFASRASVILGSGVLLGWAGGCFALTLYPPFQIPMAYLGVALFAAISSERSGFISLRNHGRVRGVALAIAVLVTLAACVGLWTAAAGPIDVLRNTVYPGMRVSTGGDRTWWELFGPNLGLASHVQAWGTLRNVCEAATTWAVAPALIVACLWARYRYDRRLTAVEIVLMIYVAGVILYSTAGIPSWLARASGLSLVPGRRIMIGLALAEVLLLVSVLGRGALLRRVPGAAIGTAWTLLLSGAVWLMATHYSEFGVRSGLMLALVNGTAVFVVVCSRRARLALGMVVLLAATSSLWFNPLVLAGTGYLHSNALAKQILDVDQRRAGKSVWLSFGNLYLPNLFRSLGVRALDGVHPTPQLELWEQLDPLGRHSDVYNRYAHVVFVAGREPELQIRLNDRDIVAVVIDPRDQRLRDLGLTHVLVQTKTPRLFQRLSGFEPLFSVGEMHAFRVVW